MANSEDVSTLTVKYRSRGFKKTQREIGSIAEAAQQVPKSIKVATQTDGVKRASQELKNLVIAAKQGNNTFGKTQSQILEANRVFQNLTPTLQQNYRESVKNAEARERLGKSIQDQITPLQRYDQALKDSDRLLKQNIINQRQAANAQREAASVYRESLGLSRNRQDVTQRLATETRKLQDALRRGVITEEEYNSQLAKTRERLNGVSNETKRAIQEFENLVTTAEYGNNTFGKTQSQILENNKVFQSLTSTLRQNYRESIKNAEARERLGKSIQNQLTPLQKYDQALKDSDRLLKQNVISQRQATNAQREAAAAYRESLGLSRSRQDATQKLATETQKLQAALRRGVITEEEYNAQLAKTRERLNGVSSGSKKASSSMSRVGARVQETNQQLLALQRTASKLKGVFEHAFGGLAAFFVVGQVEEFVRSIGEANQAYASTINTINAGTHDMQQAEHDFQNVVDLSERLGLELDETSDAYARLSVSAHEAGMNSRELNNAFEGLSKAFTATHRSGDEVNRFLVQLEQALSNQKIDERDIRAMAQALPGVREIMQDTVKDMGASMEDLSSGAVDMTDLLSALGETMEDRFGDAAEEASNSFVASLNRLKSTMFDIKTNGDFADEIAKSLTRLNDELQTDEGRRSFEDFMDTITFLFQRIIDLGAFVVRHIEEITTALKILVSIQVFRFASSLSESFVNLAGTISTLNQGISTNIARNRKLIEIFGRGSKSARAFATAITSIQKALSLVGSFVVGWEIGSYLSEKFEPVRRMGISLVSGLVKGWNRIKEGFEIASEGIKNGFSGMFNVILSRASDFLQSLGNMISHVPGVGDMGQSIMQGASSRLNDLVSSDMDRKIQDIKNKYKSERDEMNDIFTDMFNYTGGGDDKTPAPTGQEVNPKDILGENPTGEGDQGGSSSSGKSFSDLVKERTEEYEKARAELEGTMNQFKEQQYLQESQKDLGRSLTKTERDKLLEIRDQTKELQDQKKIQDDLDSIREKQQSREFKRGQELAENIKTIREAMANDQISQKEGQGLVEGEVERAKNDLDDLGNKMSQFQVRARRSMQRTIADFIYDPFDKGLDGMLHKFVDTLNRMAAEAAAAEIAEKLFGTDRNGNNSNSEDGLLSKAWDSVTSKDGILSKGWDSLGDVFSGDNGFLDSMDGIFDDFLGKQGGLFDGFLSGQDGIFSSLTDSLSNVFNSFISGGDTSTNIGGAIGDGIGSLFGGMFADGGRPPVNKPSIVGEHGPELFMPDRHGTVIPNDKIGGGSSMPSGNGRMNTTVNINYNEASGKSKEERDSDRKKLSEDMKAQLKQAWREFNQEDVNHGGPVSRSWSKAFRLNRDTKVAG